MITDVLHINCLILQKIYSVLLKQPHSHVFYIFIPYSAWLSGCGWLSAQDNCNPGCSAALPTALWWSTGCGAWGNTLETDIWVLPTDFSCICTVGAPKRWGFWELPLGPEMPEAARALPSPRNLALEVINAASGKACCKDAADLEPSLSSVERGRDWE